MADHARQHPGYSDFQVLKRAELDPQGMTALSPLAWTRRRPNSRRRHRRPGPGFTFGKDGLKGVTLPIQLWRAAEETHPAASGIRTGCADALPKTPEYHVVDNAESFRLPAA